MTALPFAACQLVRRAGATADLPARHLHTTDLPEAQAFAEWRTLLAPMFTVAPGRHTTTLPRGSVSTYLLGDLIINRCIFNAQHLTRDRDLIAAGPNRVLLVFYRYGGLHGSLGGRPVTIHPGQVGIYDMADEIDVRTAASDTIGLAIPHGLLDGIDTGGLVPRLDGRRERVLAQELTRIYRLLPRIGAAEGPEIGARLAEFVRRLLARTEPNGGAREPGPSVREGDAELRARVCALVDRLDGPITPAEIARRLGVSRATLYRSFAAMGGVMRVVQEQRLTAVHAALSDPLETRRLTDIAADHGFGSLALLSRRFRDRFGLSPSALRDRALQAARERRDASREPVQLWYPQLGA